jgi:BirA family biotin operon repressor/biotin-[acetyl-CoA-carboxylase] ligase
LENRKIIYYDTIDSTNIEVSRLAQKGAEDGTVVVAKKQTAGKGRRGRRWESPSEENLYMSLLLRPKIAPDKAPMLTLVMAYSIALALQGRGIHTQIKWPNDLIIGSRKVCGILTEMQMKDGDIDHVVVGVGLNVHTREFPEELSDKATSLLLEGYEGLCVEELLEEILVCFEKEYGVFERVENLEFLVDNYNQILVNRGKEVHIIEQNEEYIAVAKGIDTEGQLIVALPNGKEQKIYAGEVSVRGIYGYV